MVFEWFNKEKVDKMTETGKELTKKIVIDTTCTNLIEKFRSKCEYDTPELTDESLKSIVEQFFTFDRLSDANKYIYETIHNIFPDMQKIDWSLPREIRENTQEYKDWRRANNINESMYFAKRNVDIESSWVDVHGMTHTDDEAATIAADKWCDMIFGKHIQDNGAINESHPGGFMACALGTVLADKCKEGLGGDVREKAHQLFFEYYKRYIHYDRTHDKKDIEWLVENLPDTSGVGDPFDWKYFEFRVEPYCDYGANTPLFCILLNAGVPKEDIGSICPWKTGINIRTVDNAVMLNTYQHREEI